MACKHVMAEGLALRSCILRMWTALDSKIWLDGSAERYFGSCIDGGCGVIMA